ncbi:DUF1330 domain-containing protein [Anaerosporobacter faecicola]|uniref:DUF1330 domain-containing protein n=1 Tax=Anaerosporobacter faecicola TaxID=2718714 RepID=UPI00143CBD66|nr:DUF1330 domain-containing protein [Anaerosporobacter faecicola]
MYYFIATIQEKTKNIEYEEYIRLAKPIVESYGGTYLVRTEEVTYLGEYWKPNRVIVIAFSSEELIKNWLSSKEYTAIMEKRKGTVGGDAIIVGGMNYEG